MAKSLMCLGDLEDLDLSSNMLEGGISESLRNLSHLQALDLSSNNFSGDLEDFLFGNLSTKANMSMGSWRLKKFSALKKLNVGSNKFVGLMPQSLSQHSVLEEVDVSFNSLQGIISEAYFTILHNLKVLALSFNSLSLQIVQDWSPPFQLDVIRLAGCNMNPHFPQWVQTQRNVRFLDLSYAHISDEVPRWLWSLSALLSLNISHNHISGTIPHLLPTSIEYLDVSSNNLSWPLPLLQQDMLTVQLSQNMFSGSVSSICSTLLVEMRILDLSNNQLDGEIPNCWEKISNLEYLNIGNNSFSGEVPRTLGNMSMLNSLNLHANNLSGELPSTLSKCGELMFIDVGGNKLTGNIPAWIGAYKNLVYVILRRNRFYGSIPLEICSITHIQVLDLSRNNISGEIPHCFNIFTSLSKKNTTVLGVAITFYPTLYEPLKVFEYAFVEWKGGEFEYRKILQHLKLIDLSNNRLVGSIPRSFSSMRALISLNLSRNMLTGTIVSDIGEMEMLEVLDLSRNQLSGHIPNSLAKLKFMAVLDLANNSLWGRIPASTQLQSFNASAYAGNDGLCGLPLKLCPGDHPLITYQGKNI
ncbi:hypothetical protein SASPL_121074 [Salvia splendens]|uniref:LRR receptor-like serine/threonine-protein kinase FLS2 n=1 Tax=Salvia splendens TaxID=180675 RepID=A0A8X8XRX4_SALSN|nr:receptor-like protein EIX2 [Salvia splendens]XP_042068189.1 receptor-like protein EIX2 [Salvia splendens]KAG6418868.1 hypothetical protein SASPL_121074 [Salvia splendens]